MLLLLVFFFFATSLSEMVVRVLFPTIPTRCLFLLASPIFDQMRLKPVPALSFSSVDYRSNRYGYIQNLETRICSSSVSRERSFVRQFVSGGKLY